MVRALQLHRARCRAKIPPKYADLTLGQLLQRPCPPEQAVALNKLANWGKLVTNPGFLNLTVIGDKGTGKTEMLSALLGSLVHIGVDCKYTTCNDMLAKCKATWKSKDMPESAVVAEYVQPKVLVFDEISGPDREGLESLSTREIYLIETMIDERYQQQKKTVLAGNIKTMEALIALVGERVASRAQEGGVLIVCNWPSHRKWARIEEFDEAVKKSGVQLC
ncbi:ATP-binding protein [Candidatus Electronema sp. JM]|uniref:ATP-binding protein n=1 Tax=Candidatus Electronema sp. JM TaxID=3401571 RepID=UPI003AA8FA00